MNILFLDIGSQPERLSNLPNFTETVVAELGFITGLYEPKVHELLSLPQITANNLWQICILLQGTNVLLKEETPGF